MEDVPRVVEAHYGRGGILDSILYVLQDMGSGSSALGSARLGLHLLMGDGTRPKLENNIRNLAEGRLVVIQAVAEKAQETVHAAAHRLKSGIGSADVPTRAVRRTAAALLFVAVAAGCAIVSTPRCAPGEMRSVSEVVYFGTAKRAGVVTAEEWKEFLRTSVTPRFPQGFTVWPASGQWRGTDGAIVVEDSFVLNLVHPDDERNESWVRAIAAEYKARFDQEAVLRVRTQVCASL